MRFFTAIAALAGAIGTALAQTEGFHALTRPSMNEKVPAGKTFSVKWTVADEFADGQVIFGLLGGKSGATLQSLGSIGTANGGDGEFLWAVDSSLGDMNTYGLTITLISDQTTFQYSMPFSISGGAKPVSTTKSTSSVKATNTNADEEEEEEDDKTTTTTNSRSAKETTTKESKSTSTKTTEKEEETTTIRESRSSNSTTKTTSSSSSSSTLSTSTLTTYTIVTASGDGQQTPTSSAPDVSATSEPVEEEPTGTKLLGLSTGVWIGIGAGSLAGLVILIGTIVTAIKMKRSREHERYQDLDARY